MSLSAPRNLFGIHSATLYNVNSGIYYGTLRDLKSGSLAITGDLVELRGGANPYLWNIQDGNKSAELTLAGNSYPDFLYELLLGKAPTSVAAEASGNASTLTDKYGTTVVGATGLLGTVTVSTAADLKFGKYLIKATGVAAISVYWSSNIDALRGTDASEYTDDTLLIQTITGVGSGSTHVITNHGLTLTAGASAGAMTAGDTATFEVRPVTLGTNSTVLIGGINDVHPQFGAILYTAQLDTGEMFEIDVFKLRASGMSLGGEEKAFGSWSVTAKAMYDSARLGICSVRHIKPQA